MKCTQMCKLKTYDNQDTDEEEDASVRDECESCDNDSEQDENYNIDQSLWC